MPTHLFKVGSAVTLNAKGPPVPTVGRYTVEAQMPPLGTQLQYRIKSDTEGFRRVVVEHQLTPFSLTPPETPPLALPVERAARVHPGEEN